jgi:SPP1 family predicted phage head-tail adaptor
MRLGPLRHKLRIEEQSQTQDGTTGAITVAWETVATVYGAIEPLSVRNFLAADAVQSKIEANIRIRYRSDINASMRIVDVATSNVYNIEGILPDAKTGRHSMLIPVSRGVNDAGA